MGDENLNPLDELKSLDQRVDQVHELNDLKPVYARVDEIAREHSDDFEVQLVAGDIKQRLVTRGTRLKAERAQAPAVPPPLPPPQAASSDTPDEKPMPSTPLAAAPPAPEPVKRSQPISSLPVSSRPASSNWRRPMILGALLGAVVSIALIAALVNQARKRNTIEESATVDVEVATTPAGASIRVGDQNKCTAPCKVSLAPGAYQVMAFLDGYEPAASPLNVALGQAAAVNLTLAAQAQTVRVLTDLDAGKIAFDDQAPADLQEGQFVLDKVAAGPHTVRVTGKNGMDATFTFSIGEAKAPEVTGTVTAHSLAAVLVSTFGSHARVVTNSGPIKLAVNGQPEGDAGPAGVDLKAFQPGVDELVVGDGKDARNMKESFGPQPMLTAFLKSDLNIGTLIVSTGEDDVRVFLNNKEYRRKTQRGQLRIPAIGQVSVRVEKPGFEVLPAQSAEVKKGAEVRLEFKLKALPQTSSIQITGGTPGAEVLVDGKSAGAIGADGSFALNGAAPGPHTIDLRRDQFSPKHFQINLTAGKPLTLGADQTALAAVSVAGTVKIARTPAEMRVTYRRAEETQAKELGGPQIELPPGTYVFSGSAPGYTARSERVLLGAGETRTVELALARAAPAAPVLKAGDIAGFEEPGAWKKDGELWTHRGGGFVPYGMGPKGVYTFTVELLHGGNVFKGGRIRWAIQYVDSKNYQLFELDKKNFWAEVIDKGKKFERAKTQHDLEKEKAFTIQVELTPEHVVHKIRNNSGEWITLDSFAEPGRKFTEGKFGFLIQGNDEIGISDFSFQPK